MKRGAFKTFVVFSVFLFLPVLTFSQTIDCDSEIEISMPFSKDGEGVYCFVASGTVEYINSWNMDYLEVNGQDFTNVWTTSFPDAGDGKIHIQYVASVPWAHFEIHGTDSDGGTDSDEEDEDTDIDSDDNGLLFDPESGTFEGSISVKIYSQDGLEGDIRYTTDGTVPDSTSALFDGTPIPVTASTEIHAELFQNGASKATGTAVYVRRAKDITLDLPIVVIDNFGQGEPGREYVRAIFMVFDTQGGEVSLSQPPEVAAHSGFHLRGQSSAYFDKMPYRVELRDRYDDDQDWTVLGMPEDSDWIMRGPFVDRALIREAFHYSLGTDMGIPSPRFAFCEFYKNLDGDALDDDDYEGVYMVVETIKNSKNRLDLKQLHPDDTTLPDITGGYIFKFEWLASEDPILDYPGADDGWRELEIADPSDINAEQSNWLANYLYEFHQAIHSDNMADDTSGYPAYIDALSFADQIILNEIGRELDAYIRSAFFYKDRGGKVYAGPLWDYNVSLGTGISQMYDNMSVEGWMYEVNATRPDPTNDWFVRLAGNSEFQALLANRWQELREGLLSDAALNDRIDTLAAPLAAAAQRNFERWPNLGATQVVFFEGPGTETWEEQVAYMRDWLMRRVAWLDSQWY